MGGLVLPLATRTRDHWTGGLRPAAPVQGWGAPAFARLAAALAVVDPGRLVDLAHEMIAQLDMLEGDCDFEPDHDLEREP